MTQNPKSLARRLVVFRACKQYMEQHGHAPTCTEIAETTDMLPQTVAYWMHELNGADGLPYEMLTHDVHNHAGLAPGGGPGSLNQAADHYMADYHGKNLLDGFRILRA